MSASHAPAASGSARAAGFLLPLCPLAFPRELPFDFAGGGEKLFGAFFGEAVDVPDYSLI